MRDRESKKVWGIFLLTVILPLLVWPSAQAELRHIQIGQEMPSFSLPDLNGQQFSYPLPQNRALALAFLSASQNLSLQALNDIQKVVEELSPPKAEFDFLIVVSAPDLEGPLQTLKEKPQPGIGLLSDPEFKLWGLLGVVAQPTVVVVGPDRKVLWIKAGYGYDFRPALRQHLAVAAGLIDAKDQNQTFSVQTLTNDTIADKVQRHLRLSRMLEEKEHFDSAVAELNKALELDPNSTTIPLELAELLCRMGRPQDALQTLTTLPESPSQPQDRLCLVRGWAWRQLGNTEQAQKWLLKAVELNDKSSRAFFELAKIYQATSQNDKALDACFKALSLIYPEPETKDFSQQ